MAKFIVDLSEDQREKLELHRVAWGLRSHSEAVRHLIDNDPSVFTVTVNDSENVAVPEPRKTASPLPKGPIMSAMASALPKRVGITMADVRPKIEYGALAKKPKGKAP